MEIGSKDHTTAPNFNIITYKQISYRNKRALRDTNIISYRQTSLRTNKKGTLFITPDRIAMHTVVHGKVFTHKHLSSFAHKYEWSSV